MRSGGNELRCVEIYYQAWLGLDVTNWEITRETSDKMKQRK